MTTQLIDVATTTKKVAQSAPMTASAFLAEAGVDLTNSKEVVVRVNGSRITMDEMVNPGDTVLLTRNIEGG